MEADAHTSWLPTFVSRFLNKPSEFQPTDVPTAPRRQLRAPRQPLDPQIRALQNALDTDIGWIRCPEDRSFLKQLSASLAKATRGSLGLPNKLSVGEWQSVDYRLTATWHGAVPWDSTYTNYIELAHPARVVKVIVSTVIPNKKVLGTHLLDTSVSADDDDPFELSKQLGMSTIVSVFIPSRDSDEALAELRESAAVDQHHSFKRKGVAQESAVVPPTPEDTDTLDLIRATRRKQGKRLRRAPPKDYKVSKPAHGTL